MLNSEPAPGGAVPVGVVAPEPPFTLDDPNAKPLFPTGAVDAPNWNGEDADDVFDGAPNWNGAAVELDEVAGAELPKVKANPELLGCCCCAGWLPKALADDC